MSKKDKKDKKDSAVPRVAVFIAEHNPLKIGFGRDRFLFIQLFAALILFVVAEIIGLDEEIGSKRMQLYSIFLPMGIVFVLSIQTLYFFFTGYETRKKRALVYQHHSRAYRFFNFLFNFENKSSWLIILINVAVFGLVTTIAAVKGLTFAAILNEFFIASWEQLIFAVMGMTLMVTFFFFTKVAETASNTKMTTFLLAFFVVDFTFAFAHWWAYQGEWTTILILSVTGILFMSVGYFVPSLGITLHYSYNIIITIGLT